MIFTFRHDDLSVMSMRRAGLHQENHYVTMDTPNEK